MFQCDTNTFIYTDEYYTHLPADSRFSSLHRDMHLAPNKFNNNIYYIVHFTKLRD